MVSSSRNIILTLKKNLILIVAMSLLYAINSFAIGEIDLLPGTAGGGELRPFIFIPALAAIIFGPTVGAFSAGLGNFLIDIINDRLIQGDILDLGNLAGFFGNFIGAAVVGFVSWRLKFNKDDRIFFSWKIWLRYLQNTLAAVVGMGLVTGEVIGLLRVAFDKSSWIVGNQISASIFYSNSLFLLVTLIPLQLIVGIYEKARINRYQKDLHNSKNVTILEEPLNPLAVIDQFSITPGLGIDGLVKGEWSQIGMVIRNNTTVPMTFRLEINCEDRINPSVAYTKELQPQETDEKFFQINPFNDSKRIFTLYIKNWSPTYKELTETSQIGLSVRYRYTYTTLTPFEHKFNLFTRFLTICAFAVVIFNTIRTLYGDINSTFWEESKYFIWAIVVCGVELVIVLGWTLYKLITVRRKIEKAKITNKEEQQKSLEKQERELQVYNAQLNEISDKYDLEIQQSTISQEFPDVATDIQASQVSEEEPQIPTEEVAAEESKSEYEAIVDEVSFEQPPQDEKSAIETPVEEEATEETMEILDIPDILGDEIVDETQIPDIPDVDKDEVDEASKVSAITEDSKAIEDSVKIIEETMKIEDENETSISTFESNDEHQEATSEFEETPGGKEEEYDSTIDEDIANEVPEEEKSVDIDDFEEDSF